MKHVLKADYNILAKSDSENIIDVIDEFKPDLIILDHHFGDMSSTEIMAGLKLRARSFSTPVILFSAHPRLQETATDIGAAGFIEKPFQIIHIRNYVKEVISKDDLFN